MNERIKVTAAVVLENGVFLDVPDRRDDFWLYINDLIGWMRFSLRIRRKQGCAIPTIFEAVEVCSAHSPAPNPVVSASNVLWRRQEALEAERDIPLLGEVLKVLNP